MKYNPIVKHSTAAEFWLAMHVSQAEQALHWRRLGWINSARKRAAEARRYYELWRGHK